MITPTHAEKLEWARMAQAAYKSGDNVMGHRYSAYAAIPSNASIPVVAYDGLQLNYRRWLIGNLRLIGEVVA
jgi:hypothetical protein